MTHDELIASMKPFNWLMYKLGIPLVWAWPTGRMRWFFWNWGGMYRLGPLTLHLYK